MNHYQTKQIKIAGVYLLILVVIIGAGFLVSQIGGPTCSDAVQNQEEAGIDCGGPCALCDWQKQEPVEVLPTQVIATQSGYIDLVAEIKNPNLDFGGEEVNYQFNLYDAGEKLIKTQIGRTYILPKGDKYIINQKVAVDQAVDRAELIIKSVRWREFKDYQAPELLIRDIDWQQAEEGGRIKATLENRSNYDFNQVKVSALILDEKANIVAVGQMSQETVFSQERRYFEIDWLSDQNMPVSQINLSAQTNLFAETNFMKKYGGEKEDFQNY